ncbi:hypothetical protein CDV36_006926 [Fusarium kuroshium]|uniref:Zn(2)-C6 fungal-type domain-containing protein n=1 Tax=Fusarium kuroshium TaxID=2010991 RepID=A0A3M2S777_9HYPO|nr:hypothetical protein CDV36_006926 [Fusarium kuroshium]
MSETPEPESQRLRRPIGASRATPKNARIACRKCHARKVKCSGGTPCANCLQANIGAECSYPRRIRRVKVDQSYIDELLEEIHSLRKAVHTPEVANSTPSRRLETRAQSFASDGDGVNQESPTASVVNVDTSTLRPDTQATVVVDQTRPAPETDDSIRNPILEDRPWFFSLTPEMPMLIEEAADAPFATRFRQELSGKSQRHIPRTENVTDEALTSSWNTPCPWPPASRARFLLKVALNTVCRRYYLVRRSATQRLLEQAIHNPDMCDLVSECKLFVLFALGEVYSTRTSPTKDKNQLPGISYYVRASRLLRVLTEQPRIDCVEVILMLSLYSLAMNRRYNAYCMIGSAVKFSTMIGLHQNVPLSLMPDREKQEHRKRIWWSVYTLDRFWGAQIGQPVSIRDEDIDVDPPSIEGLSPESAAEDFADAEYLTANHRLTNLAAQIASLIYSRKDQRTSFSSRVQQALRDLTSWLQGLPDSLRAAMEELPPNATAPITALHLSFNQCLIRAARPIVLYVFRMRREARKSIEEERPPIGEVALTLSDACIQCARRSCRLLVESWINGSFPTFDVSYVHHLFSSSIVLAISSLSQTNESQSDSDDFDAAMQILKQLDESGNFAAREFLKSMEATRAALDSITAERSQSGQDNREPDSVAMRGGPFSFHDPRIFDAPTDTARMALTEPSFQDLLSQSDLDLQFLESSNNDQDFQGFFWANEGYQGWMNG